MLNHIIKMTVHISLSLSACTVLKWLTMDHVQLGSFFLIPRYMGSLSIFLFPKQAIESLAGMIIFARFSVGVGKEDDSWIRVQTETGWLCAASLCVSDCHVFIKWLLKCIWILSLTRSPPRHMIKNLTRLRVSGLLMSEEQDPRSRLISGDLHMHVRQSRSSMDRDVHS